MNVPPYQGTMIFRLDGRFTRGAGWARRVVRRGAAPGAPPPAPAPGRGRAHHGAYRGERRLMFRDRDRGSPFVGVGILNLSPHAVCRDSRGDRTSQATLGSEGQLRACCTANASPVVV